MSTTWRSRPEHSSALLSKCVITTTTSLCQNTIHPFLEKTESYNTWVKCKNTVKYVMTERNSSPKTEKKSHNLHSLMLFQTLWLFSVEHKISYYFWSFYLYLFIYLFFGYTLEVIGVQIVCFVLKYHILCFTGKRKRYRFRTAKRWVNEFFSEPSLWRCAEKSDFDIIWCLLLRTC